MPNHAPALWKRLGKPVQDTQENLGGMFPHLPQPIADKSGVDRVLPTTQPIFPEFTPAVFTLLSTAKNEKLTGMMTRFSPLSTPPTITTTTYIIRRGTA